MPKMFYYVLVFLFSVFISSVSQIVLKKSAGMKYESVFKEYLNLRVMGAYSIFFLSTLLTTLSYREVPLSFGPVLESTGYIYIALLSFFFLKEKMTRRKVIGTALIISGILIFAFV